jgi:Ser/Thr protein kinase RdoA (MazF antagonist)
VSTFAYVKRYPDPAARNRAHANYQWLAALGGPVRLPSLVPASEQNRLALERVEGRHATLANLPMLAGHLGDVHGAAYVGELHRARLGQPHLTQAGHVLPSFPDGRLQAVARELRAGTVPGARLPVACTQRLIAEADGPAAFYKDANPRNFLITPAGDPVTIDFDDLTLAPFGYDLAKLIVTLSMTHGPIPASDIATALSAYNAATAGHRETLPGVTWDELMIWAEIHHILTSRYAADGRYPYRWDQARPTTRPGRDRTWP